MRCNNIIYYLNIIIYLILIVIKYTKNIGKYSSMVEQLYVAQKVPCSNQGIFPKNFIFH
jgi:hypothetical protein